MQVWWTTGGTSLVWYGPCHRYSVERLPSKTCQCKDFGKLAVSWEMEIRINFKVMGTSELIQTKIHVDHMIDSLARYCSKLERLEFRWDNETLRWNYILQRINLIFDVKVFWQESEGDWFTSHKMSKAKIDGSLWRKALRDYERELWEGGQEVLVIEYLKYISNKIL